MGRKVGWESAGASPVLGSREEAEGTEEGVELVGLPAGVVVVDVVDAEVDFAPEDVAGGIEPVVLCAGAIKVLTPDGAVREAVGVL